MATTDAKPGFRLPWGADRSESEDRAETTDVARGEAVPTDQEIETPEMIDPAPAATDQVAVDDEAAASVTDSEAYLSAHSMSSPDPQPATAEPATNRKPNKFMADLTRAMQGAAEIARTDTLARFSADAKAHIEAIHASTAMEATDLRKQADDDVAAIREWSKAEIARIREETDERIAHRKAGLEREIDAHAASIEARIERIQRRVDAFEAEMAAFFERLLAEEDATRFAAMAESLPEPPPFDADAPTGAATTDESVVEVALIGDATDVPAERAVVIEPWPDAPADEDAVAVDASDSIDTTLAVADTEASLAPAAEDDAAPEETVDAGAEATEVTDAPDPRLEALSLVPDFAAAEAEAAEFTPEDAPAGEEIALIGDDALAARLAGLVPDAEDAAAASFTTRVVVTGLVSVASIAGFKRQLSRVPGVQSVGVSSGPDGEFLFAISHGSDVVLRDAITTLPGFGARVTAEADGELTVSAKDAEAEG